MKEDQLRTLVKYRMDQAKDTLREAEILFEKNALRGAVNRAYYSMFYAVLALLATKRLGSSKHNGAIGFFDKEFVKTNIFPKEMSKNLHLAFDRRQTGDYGEMVDIDKNITKTTIDNAQDFISKIEKYLFSSGFFP